MKKSALIFLATTAITLTGCVTKSTVVTPGNESPTIIQNQEPKPLQQAKAHEELGRAYLSSGSLSVALEEAKIAIAADKSYARGHDLLGLVNLALGKKAEALNSLERAYRLAPEDAEIMNDYGWALCENKKESQALEVFKKAIADPLNNAVTRPLTNSGICSLRLGRKEQAEGFFTKAVQADVTNAQPIFLLADLKFKAGKFAEARALLDKLWKVDKPNAESLALAIRTARALNNRLEVGKFTAQLKRNFPDSEEAKQLVGQ